MRCSLIAVNATRTLRVLSFTTFPHLPTFLWREEAIIIVAFIQALFRSRWLIDAGGSLILVRRFQPSCHRRLVRADHRLFVNGVVMTLANIILHLLMLHSTVGVDKAALILMECIYILSARWWMIRSDRSPNTRLALN